MNETRKDDAHEDESREDARADVRGDRPVPQGSYQEGRVESISDRPTGRDEDDRTGQGGARPDLPDASPAPRPPDAFVSSEVQKKSAEDPGASRRRG